tara:strand:+ start:7157 stop:7345 length:189 start_codon:yes stop_codon:yes gene_type:complete
MSTGELLIVSKDDNFYEYDINVKGKFHIRKKLSAGYYLILETHEKSFYQIIKDNKIVFVGTI